MITLTYWNGYLSFLLNESSSPIPPFLRGNCTASQLREKRA
jgi:hypothetical protein